jgi:endonuclease YncB( thermonuclease family)
MFKQGVHMMFFGGVMALCTGCSSGSLPTASAGSQRQNPADVAPLWDAVNDAREDAFEITPDESVEDGHFIPPQLTSGMTGQVTLVIDGDTVHVTIDNWYHRVRLQGINAPECEMVLSETRNGSQFTCSTDQEWWGHNSYLALTERLELESVTVFCEETIDGVCVIDDFGRYLTFLETDEGDVGEWMTRYGHAFTFTKYESSKRYCYCAAEQMAQIEGAGLWSLGDPETVINAMNSATQNWYYYHDDACSEAEITEDLCLY